METCCCCCFPIKFIKKDGTAEKFEGVTEADIKANIRMVEIHRSFVYALGKTLYPEYDFISHDLTKFSSAELIPYTKKFICKVDDSVNTDWKAAVQHHYDNNPHHPEYWGDQDMPEEYLKESLVDMIAAKYQHREGRTSLPTHIEPYIFEMKAMFLTRYTEADREKVLKECERLKTVDWSSRPIICKGFQSSVSPSV